MGWNAMQCNKMGDKMKIVMHAVHFAKKISYVKNRRSLSRPCSAPLRQPAVQCTSFLFPSSFPSTVQVSCTRWWRLCKGKRTCTDHVSRGRWPMGGRARERLISFPRSTSNAQLTALMVIGKDGRFDGLVAYSCIMKIMTFQPTKLSLQLVHFCCLKRQHL